MNLKFITKEWLERHDDGPDTAGPDILSSLEEFEKFLSILKEKQMTWSVRIVSKFSEEVACDTCKHWDKQTYNGPCQLPKVNWAIANLLTAVDKGCNGHMASGFAKLICDGYEKKE